MADKLDMKSMDITQGNIEKIRELFPSAVTEVMGDDGKVKLAIDFDCLKQELSDDLIAERAERYQMTWPDKSKAKVLANSRITATLRPDVEKSVDFDTTENLYIEGDNLDVLKLLRETYLGKVKMIYIDPPYNTGNDFVYEDDFAMSTEDYAEVSGQYDEQGNRLVKNLDSNGRFHTDWLNMIYPRLKVARDLLADDGVIFLSIDNNEHSNLKKICDEIFGAQNFISTFAIENNPKGRKNNAFVAESYEHCLLYAKNKAFIYDTLSHMDSKKFFKGLPNEEDSRRTLIDQYGEFKQSKRQVLGVGKSNVWARVSNPDRCFTVYYRETPVEEMMLLDEYNKATDEWIISPEGERLISEHFIRYCCYNNTDMKPAIPLYSKATMKQLFKQHSLYFKNDGTIYEKDRDSTQQITSLLTNKKFGLDLMTESATAKMEHLFGVKGVFTNTKAIDFVSALINLYPSSNLTVLDFFSGSATTAHAVMQLNAEDGGNRKFIMVQLPEKCDEKSEAYKAGYKTICDIGEERIRRAGTRIKNTLWKDQSSIFDDKDTFSRREKLDIGFRVLKLDSSNMQEVYYNPSAMTQDILAMTVDNVKADRTPLDLLFQVMLDLGIELSAKIEEHTVNGKTYYAVNDNDIIACFDDDIDNDVITAIAKQNPLYAVFKDKSFATDSVGINNEQLFKTYSPSTVVKVI